MTIKARPTVYNGIQMRSRLEADYAGWLDRNGEAWEYEPTCFAASTGQWLPDFHRIASLRGGVSCYTELKPVHLFEGNPDDSWEGPVERIERIDKLLTQMQIAWQTEPDAMLELVFWEYGAEDVAWHIWAVGSKDIWCVSGPSLPVPMIWAGLGQINYRAVR